MAKGHRYADTERFTLKVVFATSLLLFLRLDGEDSLFYRFATSFQFHSPFAKRWRALDESLRGRDAEVSPCFNPVQKEF